MTTVADSNNITVAPVDPRAGYISGLRKLADLLEQHPDLPLPYGSGNGTFPSLRVTFYMLGDTREAFTSTALRFPGPLTKEVRASTYAVAGQLDGLHFEVVAYRKDVCERVVTGTREVTKTIPAPGAEVPMVEVTETIEDVEWVCGPLLADGRAS